MADRSYSKKEKLKSRKRLGELFATGRSFSIFPVKVFFTATEMQEKGSVQAGVGVSARNFKKAVDRNRIKRLLRECYRLNKTALTEAAAAKHKALGVFFLYVGKDLPEYPALTEKMIAALNRLTDELNR
ncbi:MAG: ribonuclease P protein component [Chitinophagaceae bacterium]|nr:ribonuclease P protein component [Chitinophagaceae bacterium]